MDLYQLHYFLAIVETGNFTKAAERLFVSQPSLSVGIKKLEQELDVVLFERGGRRVLLTPAGQLFLGKAQAILQEYRSTLQELNAFKDRPTLRVGTLHTIRSSGLAQLIGAFRAKHPNALVELCTGHLENLQDWLEQGNIDVAITWLRDQDNAKTCLMLFQQHVTLAVSQTHTFAKQGRVCLADLDGQPYIKRLNCEFWRRYPQMFEEAGIQPQIVYAANNEEWAISLIQVGLGMSIMPIWRGISGVTYLPITDLKLSRTVGLKWRSQQVSEVANWFIAFARDRAADPHSPDF